MISTSESTPRRVQPPPRESGAHQHGARAAYAVREAAGSLGIGMLAIVLVAASVQPAASQQTISEVLSFLVTNRSIPTDDFVRDEQAAAATRDAISGFLLAELATLPISTSAGGFTYRLNTALGTVMRSSDSFGPFFTERSLTAGAGRLSFGVSYESSIFANVDGRDLRDGTLVSTASTLRGAAEPFDVETVSLRIRTDTITASGTIGLADRLDVSAAIPLVRLTLSGQRIDTYRGREFIQATGSATASGIGDAVIRAKYNVLRQGGSGLAIGGEGRLPTGNEDNLLGAGEVAFKPQLIASVETPRMSLNGDIGYAFGGLSAELEYNGAVTIIAVPRLTIVAEVLGRRLESFGRLAETTVPHPRLAGVDTIRLTGVQEATHRVVAVAGFKWNLGGTWLVAANILRPLTSAGLNAQWVPTVSFDYSFRR